jgi:hypothetical protein
MLDDQKSKVGEMIRKENNARAESTVSRAS